MTFADQAASLAIDALRAGNHLIVPTDSVAAVLTLRARIPAIITTSQASPTLVWADLVPDSPSLFTRLDFTALDRQSVPARLIRKLTPGPVIFQRADSGTLARNSRAPLLRAIAAGCAEPLALAEVPDGPRWTRDPGQAKLILARLGLEAATISSDQSDLASPCTIIELSPAGTSQASEPSRPSWRIVREGAYEDRFIRKQIERLILFVCTGNTCRSSMAESIAASILTADARDTNLHVASAGTSANPGDPVTSEARAALSTLGFKPVRSGARPLTRAMIAEADSILTMTASHRRAVLSIDPTADAKTSLLDPDGRDIPDPIGRPLDVYTHTAQHIRDLITRRIQEHTL